MKQIIPPDTNPDKWQFTTFRVAMFLVASLLITLFLPRETKFRYVYQESRPWRYGLLTAEFDFPIYKSDVQIQEETDSLMREFVPYFGVDTMTERRVMRELRSVLDTIPSLSANSALQRILISAFEKSYEQGVVSGEALEELNEHGFSSVIVVRKGRGELLALDRLVTSREAYFKFMQSLQHPIYKQVLERVDFSPFFIPNLVGDSAKNLQEVEALQNQVAHTDGMVQAGERIIDKGEIISPRIYNILYSLERESLKRSGASSQQYWIMLGEFLVVFLLFSSMFFYLKLFRREIYGSLRTLSFFLCLILVLLGLTLALYDRQMEMIYLIPYALIPLIVRTFFDSRTALYTHLVTVMISSLVAPFPFEFVLLQIGVGMMAVFSLKDLTQRSQIVQSALLVFLTYTLLYVGFGLLQEGDWMRLKPSMFLFFLFNGVLLLFAYPLIYIIEKIFGFVSSVTLVELSNINSPILRDFSEICPGTFQHTMQVSNLAAAASVAISANVQLARTGALFHDIGKMSNPVFFTENQSGINPHEKLSYTDSARIIISHVKDGLVIARKINLPPQVIDFICMHHGDGLTKYFYNSYRNQCPDAAIDEGLFRYPGPKPNTRETAIVMMSDCVEATSRSLKEYTDESITLMVNRIIDTLVADSLLENAPITFRDVKTIKRVFIEKLKTIYHVRIQYPELK